MNSLELAMDAVTHIQKRFYKDYPPHPSETEYQFATPSTMKPTLIKVSCHCVIKNNTSPLDLLNVWDL